MKPLGLLTLTGLLAACGRTPLDPGGSPGDERGEPGSPGQSASGPGLYDAGDGTCVGGCSSPPGTIQLDPSVAEVRAALIGVWQICSGGHAIFTGAPSDTIGVELAPPTASGTNTGWLGNMYFLKRGASGPVRGEGSDYQQTYEVIDDMSVSCRSQGNKIWYDLRFKYSPCPRQWWFHNEIYGPSGALASF